MTSYHFSLRDIFSKTEVADVIQQGLFPWKRVITLLLF